ncbi:MAG: hypothetical protein ACI9NN_001230, partial [Bacteroidia bacterium]
KDYKNIKNFDELLDLENGKIGTEMRNLLFNKAA